MTVCESHGITIHAELKRDPTRTTHIRNSFSKDLVDRFKRLKKLIREEIVFGDGFGLKANRGKFEFERSATKISAFMDWLREQQRRNILEVSVGSTQDEAAERAWSSVYVRSAYQKGVAQAAARMQKAGGKVEQRWIDGAFMRPIHADRLGIAYSRVFTQLQGITEAMDQQISLVLAESLAEGVGPAETARRINNRVDKIGVTRARILAQTETINAHAEASLNAYQEAGVEGVEAEAEFATAGDDRVCPECASLEGRVYPLAKARGVIPVHPRCRCAWIPRIVNGSGIELL